MADHDLSRVPLGDELYERALRLIPMGTQTNSKRPPEALRGAYPPFVARGQGAYVWDLDGNRYVDCKLGCGPVILGHAYPAVSQAVKARIDEGTVYGSAHPSEVTLAELLVEVIPCAEMVRFLKTGAEGMAAAVRLARAHTGRELVLSRGYHGWADWSLAKNADVGGIPACLRDLTLDVGFGDYEALERLFAARGEEVAAFTFAAPYDADPLAVLRFAQRLRELTHKSGALLIFDEIVTGFRVALGGLQEYSGVVPDLAVFSKALANGFPLAAVAGRADIMHLWERTRVSSTFGGDTTAIAAAIACVQELRQKGVPAVIARRGEWFGREVVSLAQEAGFAMEQMGFGGLPYLKPVGADAARATDLHRALLLEGIMPYFPLWFLSYSHDETVLGEVLTAFRRALRRL